MKRSRINELIDEAINFFDSSKLALPKWSKWSCEDWKEHISKDTIEIRTHGMGWNVTDFGSGNFESHGLLLFILRNGRLIDGAPADTKTYAEKAMMVRSGQVTPWHFHWMKTEDLINRGGGSLEVELAWISSDEKSLDSKEVEVQVDGITRRVPSGGKIVLDPGESVTLPPRLCHQFRGGENCRCVCVGEVSSLNDDGSDNCFPFGIAPMKIEEDVIPKYWLCSEYPL